MRNVFTAAQMMTVAIEEINRLCIQNAEKTNADITDFSICMVCGKEKAPIETGVCKKCSKKVRRP